MARITVFNNGVAVFVDSELYDTSILVDSIAVLFKSEKTSATLILSIEEAKKLLEKLSKTVEQLEKQLEG